MPNVTFKTRTHGTVGSYTSQGNCSYNTYSNSSNSYQLSLTFANVTHQSFVVTETRGNSYAGSRSLNNKWPIGDALYSNISAIYDSDSTSTTPLSGTLTGGSWKPTHHPIPGPDDPPPDLDWVGTTDSK
jgi:hypothetical protein